MKKYLINILIITSLFMTMTGSSSQVLAAVVCSPPANENPVARTKEINEKLTSLIISRGHGSKSKLIGQAALFVAAGQIYGVDPALLLAITLLETKDGTAEPFTKGNNPGGIKPGGNLQVYATPEQGILDFARLLRDRYISQGLITLEAIGEVYAPPISNNNKEWPKNVGYLLEKLGGTTYTCTNQPITIQKDPIYPNPNPKFPEFLRLAAQIQENLAPQGTAPLAQLNTISFNNQTTLLAPLNTTASNSGTNNQETEDDKLIDRIVFFNSPQHKDKLESIGYKAKYNQYAPSRYQLEANDSPERSFYEVGKKISDALNVGLMKLINLIWEIMISVAFLMINLIQNAFNLDIVNDLADQVEESVQTVAGWDNNSIEGGLWGPLISIISILLGLWGIIQSAKRQYIKFWSGLGVSFAILLFSIGFFVNASFFLKTLNNISSEINQSVLVATLNTHSENKTDNRTAPYVLSDKLYEMLIYDPYLMLQHGGSRASLDADRQTSFLKIPVSDKETRSNQIKEELRIDGNIMDIEKVFDRLLLLILFMFTYLIVIIVLIVISALIIFYQIYLLILAIVYPIVGLISILPYFRGIWKDWGAKILRAAFMKFGYSFLLILILVMSDLSYSIVDTTSNDNNLNQLLWAMFLQLIIVAGVIYKRAEILGFLNLGASKAEGLLISYGKTIKRNTQRTIKGSTKSGLSIAGKGYRAVKYGPKASFQRVRNRIENRIKQKVTKTFNPHNSKGEEIKNASSKGRSESNSGAQRPSQNDNRKKVIQFKQRKRKTS